MIAYSSNCLISPGWLPSIAEGDSIINTTLLTTVDSRTEYINQFDRLFVGTYQEWVLYVHQVINSSFGLMR